MWKTLVLLWSVNLCLSDRRITISTEKAIHLLKNSEISNENECRQICRESLFTDNPHCGKSLLLNKWCAVMLCNKLCHATGAQMTADPLLSRNYLKKRRKRNTAGKLRNKNNKRNTVAHIASSAATTAMSTRETTKTIETITEPSATIKTVPAVTGQPAKHTTGSTEKTRTTPATSSKTTTSTTTTVQSSTRTEHPAKQTSTSTEKTIETSTTSSTARTSTTVQSVNSKVPIIATTKAPVTVKSLEVETTVGNSTESTTKTSHSLKLPATNITENATIEQKDNSVTTEEVNTIPGKVPFTTPTIIKSIEPTVMPTTVSLVPAIPSTNAKEPLPAHPTEGKTTLQSTLTSVIPNTTGEPVHIETTPISPTTTTTTTTMLPTTPEPTKPLTTMRPTTIPVLTTPVPVPLVTTSSPKETTSATKPGALSTSTGGNPDTEKTSGPDPHILISTTASTVSSFTDGNQKKEEDNSIVIVAGEVTKHVQNTSFLLAVLMLGNLFFIAVIVLFILQAYESYKKKDYTQVDYLINGMYADSDM